MANRKTKSNYDKVVEQVKKLNRAEQWRLMDLIEMLLDPPPENQTEEEWEQQMLKEGVLDFVPRPPTEEDIRRFRAFKPIAIKGKPVSESVIEDRR
jgi:hypothetical protein